MKATIGRIVHFTFPHAEIHGFDSPAGQSQTVPAMIVAVWSDECVNLRVFTDSSQGTVVRTSVPLRTEHHNVNEGFYWEWPNREN